MSVTPQSMKPCRFSTSNRPVGIVLWLMLWLLAPLLAAHGAEPPEEPLLRIESGMHTAKIGRIAVDAAERYLVTGSSDKTVRVWELASGRLLKTLRVPIGEDANEGKVYAVALSPDGRTVAAGGWDWDSKDSIYLFDRQSGRLSRRISGLPNVINHLALFA